jgi:hypothetical protein
MITWKYTAVLLACYLFQERGQEITISAVAEECKNAHKMASQIKFDPKMRIVTPRDDSLALELAYYLYSRKDFLKLLKFQLGLPIKY